MQRKIIIALAILVILLAVALAFVLLRGGSEGRPVTVSNEAVDVNAIEPLHREMNCIDQLLQHNDMDANEVEPALARCKAPASGNRSAGQ